MTTLSPPAAPSRRLASPPRPPRGHRPGPRPHPAEADCAGSSRCIPEHTTCGVPYSEDRLDFINEKWLPAGDAVQRAEHDLLDPMAAAGRRRYRRGRPALREHWRLPRVRRALASTSAPTSWSSSWPTSRTWRSAPTPPTPGGTPSRRPTTTSTGRPPMRPWATAPRPMPTTPASAGMNGRPRTRPGPLRARLPADLTPAGARHRCRAPPIVTPRRRDRRGARERVKAGRLVHGRPSVRLPPVKSTTMNILLVENPTHQVTVPPAIWLRLAARCRPPSAPGGTRRTRSPTPWPASPPRPAAVARRRGGTGRELLPVFPGDDGRRAGGPRPAAGRTGRTPRGARSPATPGTLPMATCTRALS